MATQMQQTRTAGRVIVRSIAAGIIGMAGVVGIGAALFSSHPQTPTAASRVIVATNPVLGVDAPAGADLANLPAGYTDYIHNVPSVIATNPVLGVDAPAGVDLNTLPSGYRDYVRPAVVTSGTNPVLGVDAPAGVDLNTLPSGYRDYVRHQ
jgi:hypothetical protein